MMIPSVRFGQVDKTQIQPGFAMQEFGNTIYLVKQRGNDQQKYLDNKGYPRFMKPNEPLLGVYEYHKWLEVDYTAVAYTKQPDGSYQLTDENVTTPVMFGPEGTNPFADPVEVVKKKGDRIWIKA
jgi:hypothetical protein